MSGPPSTFSDEGAKDAKDAFSDSDSDDEEDPDSYESTTETCVYANNSNSQDDSGDAVTSARKVAEQETARLRLWRFVVMDTIVMIATVLILTTYTIRREGQHVQFQVAFDQVATTIGEHVLQQQRVLQSTLQEFAFVIGTSAESAGAVWPFYTLPLFETHVHQVQKTLPSLQAMGLFSKVDRDQRQEWVEYADMTHTQVVMEGNVLAGTLEAVRPVGYHSFISRMDHAEKGELVEDWDRPYYFPSLTWSPPPATYQAINWNMASDKAFGDTIQALMDLQYLDQDAQDDVLYTVPQQVDPLYPRPFDSGSDNNNNNNNKDDDHQPYTYALTPVHHVLAGSDRSPQTTNHRIMVGVVSAAFTWGDALFDILPPSLGTVVAVVQSSCGQVFSYQIEGAQAFYLGPTDQHDAQFDTNMVEINLVANNVTTTANATGTCDFVLKLYPTEAFWDHYVNFNPEIFAMVAALSFFVIALVYFVYDKLVDRRNEKLVTRFARSNAIVSSLFPKEYRERLMGDDQDDSNKKGAGSLKSFMSSGLTTGNHALNGASKPLADLFPDVSILFADLVGFTAWSSVREPNQVFLLLETLYSSFDDIAGNRRIFKVETVGDCYVAAAGLPDPRKDHAVALVRFAKDILQKMQVLTKELEVILGPDTGDLSLRTGIHSGPVTAGILRGKKARFQLFGDSMNTTSRVESTGLPGRIHVSHATATLLCKAGKSHWVRKRTDLVAAKGKGVLQTYWVTSGDGGKDAESTASGSSGPTRIGVNGLSPTKSRKAIAAQADSVNLSERVDRLVEWNVGALLHLLKEIVARREAQNEVASKTSTKEPDMEMLKASKGLPLEEVKEIIPLPEFDRAAANRQRKTDQVEIPSQVVAELRKLVRGIAGMYQDNPFHNFEHASHVTMSVTKLLARIVAPTDLEIEEDSENSHVGAAATLHDHTYGITSDPLTRFACVFSALIHDVQHSGVPNAQLVIEGSEIATYYKNRSVAEQNSFDLSWSLFMASAFDALRAAVCPTPSELHHFRELVVNCVMATDIADKDLKQLRNDRWQKAFDKTANLQQAIEAENPADAARMSANRKATIVIEHLIQASDVAHTMQHWHIYRKWNERFFRECYAAYKQGRAASDPREYWFKGEIGFFDFYIIPLAKKLKECGVFGVSSDEYLNYAQNNRDEWEARGEEIVAELALKAEKEYNGSSSSTAITTDSEESRHHDQVDLK